VAAIVDRHIKSARGVAGVIIPDSITPHSFRHQKAVDLIDAGIPLIYIRDLLGHKSVTTTEVYAKVSTERRREVLGKAAIVLGDESYPDWTEDDDLMGWLSRLCR